MTFKNLVGTILIIVAGFYGLIFFFADLGPGETQLIRLAIALGYFLIAALITDWFLYPRWKISFLLLWAVTMVSVLNAMTAIAEGLNSIILNLAMLVIPLIAVLSSRFVVKFLKSKYKST